ncbi:hypothetical protein TRIP_B120007 [uncultured Desulfatiglans sp.]|nr:hypothetical protein TRIP_B120007 [uncultured Desulfatiglans sp.]
MDGFHPGVPYLSGGALAFPSQGPPFQLGSVSLTGVPAANSNTNGDKPAYLIPTLLLLMDDKKAFEIINRSYHASIFKCPLCPCG